MRAYAHANRSKWVDYWYKPSSWDLPFYLFFLVPVLVGLSYLYQGILWLRRGCYALGIKKITSFNTPIIVVGNISVGGTGKSPLVLYLTEYLISRGFRPGIVSRGYKGSKNSRPQWVVCDSDPLLVGDEPVMLAQQTTCPVVVCRDRVAAVKALLSRTDCNIIVSDDGLQHYALARNIEIAVMHAERGWGNGLCLPAGPLREPIERLNTVDFICVQGKQPFSFSAQQYLMHYIPGDVYQIVNRQAVLDIQDLTRYPIHAVAGIGNPQQFFHMLRHLGLHIIEHVFPDHHRFTVDDIDFGFESLVIMTEKDAVKCQHFADDRHWCLPISLAIEPLFIENFRKKLDETLAKVKNEAILV